MKRLFSILFIITTIYGCSTLKPFEEKIIITGIDFSEYSAKGFLITPEKYYGAYESIAIMNIELNAELYIGEKELRNEDGYLKTKPIKVKEKYYKKIDPDEGIDSMYNLAIMKGADAVINFNVKEEIGKNDVPHLIISGFAIKRKE